MTGTPAATKGGGNAGGGDKSKQLDASSKAAAAGGQGDAGSPTTSCPKAKIEVVVKRPSPAKGEQPFDCQVVLTETANDSKRSQSGPCDQAVTFAGLDPGSFEVAAEVPAGKGYSFKAPKTAAASAGSTTKVTLELVKLEVTEVTPSADARQFINLDRAAVDPADPHLGRTVKVKVKISEAKKDEVVHLHLEPGDKNLAGLTGDKAAKVDPTVTTDDKGEAEVEVTLSVYGGDRFRLVASLCEDPKHPCAATKTSGWFTVWRRIWYHAAIAEGFVVPAPQRSIDSWKEVFVDFADAGTIRFKPADLSADLRARTYYPRWMLVGGVDEAQAAAITDFNRNTLQDLVTDDPKKPLKAPMLVGESMLRDYGTSQQIETTFTSLQRDPTTNEDYVELTVPDNRSVIVKPPIQTGDLVASGEWAIETSNWQSAGRKLSSLWARARGATPTAHGDTEGRLTDADIKIPKGRSNRRTFRVLWPRNAAKPSADEPGRIKIKLQQCRSILGLSSGGKIVAVFDPGDVNDYSDTITHEIGHSVGQTAKTTVAPLPANHWYEDIHGGRGDHCHSVNGDQAGTLVDVDPPQQTQDGREITRIYRTGDCVMFHSYDPSCTGKFCPKCAPYVRVQDMDSWRPSV